MVLQALVTAGVSHLLPAQSPTRRDAAPHAAVWLGQRQVTLDARAGQFPAGKDFEDRSHEGARTICLAYPRAAAPALLLLHDEDLGLSYVALAAPESAPFEGCPQRDGTVRLEYRGQVYTLLTAPADIRRQFGTPTRQRGDTLTWAVEWDRVASLRNPAGRVAPVALVGTSGLEIVERAGRLVYLAVWWLETT